MNVSDPTNLISTDSRITTGSTQVGQDLRVANAHTDAAEEKFRLLVDSVKDYAIFMIDVNGVIQNWNQGAARIKGYRADEVVGKSFTIFYTEEDKLRKHPEHELVPPQFNFFRFCSWIS